MSGSTPSAPSRALRDLFGSSPGSTQVNASPAKNKTIRHDWTKFVTVAVGKEPCLKSFVAYESILCSRSEFFKNALKGNWKESEERVVKLPEEDPEIFSNWLDVVNCGEFPFDWKNESQSLSFENCANLVRQRYDMLCKVYLLADLFRDIKAKNASIRAIHSAASYRKGEFWWDPSPDTVSYVYDRTAEDSPLRRLLVDLWSDRLRSVLKASHVIKKLPTEFVVDILLRVRPVDQKNIAKSKAASEYLEKE